MEISELWDKVKGLFMSDPALAERDVARSRVKVVANWDGDSSRWPDAGAYCDACLINLNPDAGKEDRESWVKGLCMLPVREPGDGDGTLVETAIKGASRGGRLTGLKKPDGVSDAAWSASLRTAARRLIRFHGDMGEDPPEHLYALARGEDVAEPDAEPEPDAKPVEKDSTEETARAMAIGNIIQQVQDALWAGVEQSTDGAVVAAPPQLMDIFVDESGVMALLNSRGKLYRAPLSIAGGTVSVGGWQEVEQEFAVRQRAENGFHILRESSGAARWFGIAAVNTLNRSGEIDSAELFRSLVANFRAGHAPVPLDFFHEPTLIAGDVDWLETDGHVLVASGLLADNALGRAVAEAVPGGRGRWGQSISFEPTDEPEDAVITAGVTIPVYKAGVLRGIAVLPEGLAASLFTRLGVEVTRMRKDVESALIALFGDEGKAKAFIAEVDATNRTIDAEGLITRQVAPVAPEAEAEESKGEPVEGLVERIVNEKLEKLQDAAALIQAAVGPIVERLSALEALEAQRQEVYRQDLPAAAASASFRPREQRQAGTRSLADIAAATLSNMRPVHGSGS